MVITVDRQRFRLEIWQHHPLRGPQDAYRRTGKYKVGVGRVGNATPRGVYMVVSKSRTPDWQVPNSEWAIAKGLTPGDRYEFSHPRNPFDGGFISLSGGEGIGIHGTKFDPEVGTRGSAGCVRMLVADFEAIYATVDPGTPVVIL
jgi:L,D-transpeptidase ErfK/SrfK